MSNEPHPQTLIALLHLDELAESAWVVDVPSADCALALQSQSQRDLTFVCSSFERYESLVSEGFGPRSVHAVWPVGVRDSALVYVPKSRARLEATLDWCSRAVAPGGTVLLTGHKREGIKSAKRKLEERVGSSWKQEFARHCSLWKARVERPPAAPPTPEFWRDPELGERAIAALPGTFAAKKLDDGTRLLLQKLPTMRGRVLDLACGAGPIAVWALDHGATSTVCADDDALAIEACRLTMVANDLQAAVLASNGLSAVTGRFDAILCNPPFHDGVDTRYDIGERLCREAGGFLEGTGEVWLVANRFLGYGDWLRASFADVSEQADDGRFRVFRARAPR